MLESRKVVFWIGVLVVATGIAGAGFFGGFEVSTRQIFPFELMSKIDRKLEQLVFSRVIQSATIETTLIELQREDVAVSSGFELQLKWGGGLTSFGKDVLVLRYSGDVFAAVSREDLRKTSITAPDNHRAAYENDYRALGAGPDSTRPEARGVDYLRYNDILHFDTPAWRGLIVSYTEYHPEQQCVTNTLAKLEIDRAITSIDEISASAGDWVIFYRSKPCLPFKLKGVAMEGHMAGGRMVADSISSIYLTSGDFGFDGIRADGPALAQDPESQYGKVLSIDVLTGETDIFSAGLRNMQGIARMDDGRLFTVEHGMRGGDELNLIHKGANFGWPLVTHGTLYSKQPLPGSANIGRHDGYESPVYSWLPSVAVSSLTVVRGFHEAWDGDLLVGTLKDASLYRLRLESGRVVYAERMKIGSRIRYVHQHTDGRIVLWTDNHGLIFLQGYDLPDAEAHFDEYLKAADLNESGKMQLKTAIMVCAECHSFSSSDQVSAPGLSKIYGERIASTPFDGYSDALRSKGGRWTEENLEEYLTDPDSFAPGTVMPAQELGDPLLVKRIVVYLKHLDSQR
jgi:cytochrome c2